MSTEGLVFGAGVLKIGDITVGILQDVSISVATTYVNLRGGDSLFPLAKRASERTISGSAKHAEIDGGLIAAILGGDRTAGEHVVNSNTTPPNFVVNLKNPTDGSELEVTLHKCFATGFDMALVYNDFMMPNFEFEATADGDGKVMTIATPE